MTKNIFVTGGFDDPRNPTAWSGTPANIIRALEKNGWGVFGAGYEPPLSLKVLMKGVALAKSEPDFRRDAWARRWSARRVEELADDAKCEWILHMGSFGLPLTPCRRHRHYVYLDSTYHLMAKMFSAIAFREAFDALENASLNNAAGIFTTGKYVRDNIVTHYGIPPHRVRIAGTGRGEITPFGGTGKSGTGILFVGKTRFEQKGGNLLLEAFRLVRQHRKDLRLTMVAPENYRARIEAQDGVEFRTKLSWPELEKLFHESVLYAMPAPYEPWGLVYLEALASGCAILGLNRNALPEMTQNGRFGYLVEEASPDIVASALLKAFENPEHMATMGAEGQRYCLSHYSWQKTAETIAAEIEAPTVR